MKKKYKKVLEWIGKEIKLCRNCAELRQVDVAKKAKLNYRHYQNIEYGKADLKMSTLAKILDVLDTTPDGFFASWKQ